MLIDFFADTTASVVRLQIFFFFFLRQFGFSYVSLPVVCGDVFWFMFENVTLHLNLLLPPVVLSLPQPTPIPLRPPTASSRPPLLDMQWRHPTLQLQFRQHGLLSLPLMLPIRTTRPPLSMPTDSLTLRRPLSPPPPRRRTRYTQTRSVFFCFFDGFFASVFFVCDVILNKWILCYVLWLLMQSST